MALSSPLLPSPYVCMRALTYTYEVWKSLPHNAMMAHKAVSSCLAPSPVSGDPQQSACDLL